MEVPVEHDRGAGRSRAAVTALSAAVSVLLIAGAIAAFAQAGSDTEARDPLSQLSAAPAAARAAGTARMSIVSDTEASGQTFSFTMDGTADLASGASELTASFDLLGQAFGFELRTDGEQAWISVPEANRAASEGKPWIVIATEALAGGQQQLDLGAQLAYLDALVAADETEIIGPDDVRGVSTTHYRTTIDLTDPDLGMPQQQLQQLRDLGVERLPTDIWLDDDGLPLRQVVTVDVQGAQNTTTVELYDFGVPFELAVPDPAETFAVSDVATIASFFTPSR